MTGTAALGYEKIAIMFGSNLAGSGEGEVCNTGNSSGLQMGS